MNAHNHQARLIVISSVSGGGKTTLIDILKKEFPQIRSAITATSRQPRQGEVPGVHYIFLTPDDFRRRIDNDEFLEHARVHGNYYGVPIGPVFEELERGHSVILNIDVQGQRSVRRRLGDRVLSIFIKPPDHRIWEERLRKRGTDSEDEIRGRLEEGLREMECATDYDYCVVNDRLERAVGEIVDILRREGILAADDNSSRDE